MEAEHGGILLKRSLNRLEEVSSPKRQKIAYHRHHALQHKAQSTASQEPALLDPETVEKLLITAIKDVLQEEALKQDIYSPQIESLALEAIRGAAEECKNKLSENRNSVDTPRHHEHLLESAPIDAHSTPDSAHTYRLRVSHSCP